MANSNLRKHSDSGPSPGQATPTKTPTSTSTKTPTPSSASRVTRGTSAHAAPACAAPPRCAALPLADDGTVGGDMDIAFSTHLTLVIQAHLEFDGPGEPQTIHLVVARSHCRHGRPRLPALLDAAMAALGRAALAGRAPRLPRRVQARIAGQWHALWTRPAVAIGHALPAA